MANEILEISFKIGDEVMAKMDDEFFVKGTVVKVKPGLAYRVRFDTGIEQDINIRDVKPLDSLKARGRSAGKKRAPAKKRTPSSSRSRSKSAGRTPRTRSTSATRKKTPKKASTPKRPPTPKKGRGRKVASRSTSPSTSDDDTKKPRSPSRSPARKVTQRPSKKVAAEPPVEPPPLIRRELELPKDKAQAVEAPALSRPSAPGVLSSIFQFVFLPALVFYAYVVNAQPDPSVWKVPAVPTSPSMYFDVWTLGAYCTWALIQAFLVCFPVGEVVCMPGLSYRLNGMFGVIVNCLVLGLLLGIGCFPLRLVYESYLPLIVSSFMFALVFSVVLYVHGTVAARHDPSSARQGGFLGKFVDGHLIHPRFGQLFDVKIFLFRLGMIGWATVLVGLLHHNWVKDGCMKDSILVGALLQLFYILMFYMWEGRALTTHTFQQERVGSTFATGCCAVMPFLQSVQLLYQLNNPQHLPFASFGVAFVLFPLGAYIYIVSNAQKHKYRQDPYGLDSASLNKIHTREDTNLLCDGWWGYVRHPNYLGDLLMHVAWGVLCGCQHSSPYVPTAITIFNLVVRAIIVERDCKLKYGHYWDKYCSSVRYRLIPFVF